MGTTMRFILGLLGYCFATPHVLTHEISVRPRERRDPDNPNGWDPLFDWTIVHGNEFLEYWNVTYQDLINKPIEALILIQEVYERSEELGEVCVRYGDIWVQDFTADNFKDGTMIEWALGMGIIIDEIMAIVKFGMKEMESIMYPWVQYKTNEILTIYINPYIYNGVVNVIDWSGEATFVMYGMLVQWVKQGRGWIAEFKDDFEYHKLYIVTRDLRQMAERFEVVLAGFLTDWEEILCGPRRSDGSCDWLEIDLTFIIPYYEYLFFFIDRLDVALEWISLTIGNIIDAVQTDDQN